MRCQSLCTRGLRQGKCIRTTRNTFNINLRRMTTTMNITMPLCHEHEDSRKSRKTIYMPNLLDHAWMNDDGEFKVNIDEDISFSPYYPMPLWKVLMKGYTYVGDDYLIRDAQDIMVELDIEGDYAEMFDDQGIEQNISVYTLNSMWITEKDYKFHTFPSFKPKSILFSTLLDSYDYYGIELATFFVRFR